LNLNLAEEYAALVSGGYAHAYAIMRPVTQEEELIFTLTVNVFSGAEVASGGIYQAATALRSWYSQLQPISRNEALFEGAEAEFLQLLSRIDKLDDVGFARGELYPFVASQVASAARTEIEQWLSNLRRNIEDAAELVKVKLRAGIAEILGLEGGLTDIDLQDAFRAWYGKLDHYQQNLFSPFHSAASKQLVKAVRDMESPGDFLYGALPRCFLLSELATWQTDRSKVIIDGLKVVMTLVAHNPSPIAEPLVKMLGQYQNRQGAIYYQAPFELRVELPPEAAEVVLSDDKSDPTSHGGTAARYQQSFNLPIAGNMILRLAAKDLQGRYSRVKNYTLIDDLQKNEIKIEQPPVGEVAVAQVVTFEFPADAAGVETAVTSLLKQALQAKVIERPVMVELLRRLTEKEWQ